MSCIYWLINKDVSANDLGEQSQMRELNKDI